MGAGERRGANGGGLGSSEREQRRAPQWFLQHGSSPAPHGLAGESVGVCPGRVCVCLGRVLNASPNANARRLKMGGSLLLTLPSFGKVYFRLLVLAFIFFLSRRTASQRDAPVIHFGFQKSVI